LACKIEKEIIEIPDKKALSNIYQERPVGRPSEVGEALSFD